MIQPFPSARRLDSRHVKKAAFLISILLICLANFSSGQSFTLIGVVLSSDSARPIPFSNISLKNQRQGSMSNERGVFQVSYQPGDTLQFSALGFENRELVFAQSDSGLVLRIFLKRKVYSIGDVEVKGIKTKEQLRSAILNLKLEPEKEIIIPGAKQYKGPLDPGKPTAMSPISALYETKWAKKARSKKFAAGQNMPRMK